jgi:putative peptidoglycan lipid II flippase
LLLPLIIANWYGATAETDAFYFSYGIILYLSTIISPAMEKIIVPFLTEIKHSAQQVSDMINSLIASTALIVVLLTLLVISALKYLLPTLLYEFDSDSIVLAYRILLIVSPMALALVLSSIITGSLNSFKKFKYPAISPLARFLIILISMLLLRDRFGIYSIAIAYLAGEYARLIFLLIVVIKLNILKPKFILQQKKILSKFFKSSSFQLGATLLFGITVIVDRVIASSIEAGSISILHYSERIYYIPFTLVSIGLIPVLLTHWGDDFNNKLEKDISKFISKLYSSIKYLSYILVPLVLILIIFSKPIISLMLFNDSVIVSAQVDQIFYTYIILCLGLLPALAAAIITNAFIVLRQTKYIMYIALIVVIVKPAMSYCFATYYGLYGLALSSTLAHYLVILVSIYIINHIRIVNSEIKTVC